MAQFKAIPAARWVVGVLIENAGAAFHISWPWMTVVLAVTALIILVNPGLAPVLTVNITLEQLMSLSFGWAVALLYYAVLLIACSSIGVNWCRYLLLGETPESWQRVRLDALVWRYAGTLLIISLAVLLVWRGCNAMVRDMAVLAGYVVRDLTNVHTGDAPGSWVAMAIILVVLLFFVIYVIGLGYMLSLKLAAISVGESYRFRDANLDSKGNFLSLMGFALLTSIPSLLADVAAMGVGYLGAVIAGQESHISLLVVHLGAALAFWFRVMVALTAITLLYAIFKHGAEID
jgi:hypothetical protein